MRSETSTGTRPASMRHLVIRLTITMLTSTLAAGSELKNDASTGEPGKFAAAEILREANLKGMTSALNLDITVEKRVKAVAQSYRIKRDGEKLTVSGADPVGAMYGGLDIAEAIRTGTLESLKESEHSPHIAQRGIK